jgi:hypothetical protein
MVGVAREGDFYKSSPGESNVLWRVETTEKQNFSSGILQPPWEAF